jgi:hypothetical protein
MRLASAASPRSRTSSRRVIAERARDEHQPLRLDGHVVRAADDLGPARIEERAVAVAAEAPLVAPRIAAVVGEDDIVIQFTGDVVREGQRAHRARVRAGGVDGVAWPTAIAGVRRRLLAAAVRRAALVPPRPRRIGAALDGPRAAR